MTKKLLALSVSIIMVMSLFCAIPVSAETTLPTNLATDYEPGEKVNAITTETLGLSYALGGGYSWNGVNATTTFNDETVWAFGTGNAGTVLEKVTQTGGWGVHGSSISGFTEEDVYEAGKKVVVSFQANRWYDSYVTSGSNAVMNVAIRHQDNLPIYSSEYPNGVEVSNSDWQTYSFTFDIPEGAAAGDLTLAVGFAYTGIEGEPRRGFNIKAGTIFVNKECAYDIDVTADKAKVFAGAGSVTVDADVLNQLGNVGGLSQNVTWYALNDARDAVAEGITVKPGENGTATVSAASTVAAGTYAIVAVADEDANLVKGIEITVADLATDTDVVALADRTDNVITDPYGWAGSGFPAGWTYAAPSSASNYNGEYTLTSYVNTQQSSDGTTIWNDNDIGRAAARGVRFDKTKSGITSLYQPGATMVFSANVVSWNPNNPKLTWGIYQPNYKAILPMEYPSRTDGFETSSTAWKRFGGTVAIPEDCDTLDSATFDFGFSKMDAPAGTSDTEKYGVRINAATMYLAPEAASSMTLTADKTEMYVFESINLDADVLNQVDYTGNLSQDVTWYAMDATRTNIVSGITVTPGENGTAVVTADDTIASGVYNIVAVSADNEVVKGIEIAITNLSKDFEKVALADRTDNAITDPYSWGNTGFDGVNLTWNQTTGPDNSSGNYTFTSSVATSQFEDDATSSYAAQGISINKGKFDTSIYQPGNTLVFSASVISWNDNKPKLTWGMYQEDKKSLLPMEYPTRADGYEAVAGAWTRFGGTVAIPEDCVAVGGTLFSFGFSKMDAPAGTSNTEKYGVNVNAASMYLAVEAASDIVITADKTSAILGEATTVKLDADVLNQVDYTGNLSQDITWYAMNDARDTFIDEIEIVAGENGTATVTLPATLEAGTYNIVAVSDANAALVKATEITVAEATITETTIASDGTSITVSASEDIENAVLVFAQYDSNGKLTAIDVTTYSAVSVAANKTATYAIPEGFTTGKVMLWKDLSTFKPLAAAIN